MSTPTRSSGVEPLKLSRIRVWPDGRIAWFNRLFNSLLFVFACCASVMTSGCGSGIVERAIPGGIDTGTGAAAPSPQLMVSAATLGFGSVTLNTSTTQTVTLTSTGSSAVMVSGVAIAGAGFSLVGGGVPVTLAPTQSVTLQVQFKPTVTGRVTGQLTITSDSGSNGTAVVALSGTGAAAPSPQLMVSAVTLRFGSVTVNMAPTQMVTLTSTGSSAVMVSGVAIAGAGFSLVGGGVPVTLAPTQSVTLQVQFKPTVTGRVTGQLTITSDSGNGGTMIVALNGTGTAANPQLMVSAATLGFGSVTLNTSTTQTVTLTSTGSSAVMVSGAVIAGTEFSLVGGSFPVTMAPTQSVTLQVQFKPTVTGRVTGQLTITSDSSNGGTAVVVLSGTGAAIPHEVDLSWDAPSSSSDPVASYNIYRSTGSGAFQQMNSSANPQAVYVDPTVVSGVRYNYIVKSVDSVGVESVPSNQITVAIP